MNVCPINSNITFGKIILDCENPTSAEKSFLCKLMKLMKKKINI